MVPSNTCTCCGATITAGCYGGHVVTCGCRYTRWHDAEPVSRALPLRYMPKKEANKQRRQSLDNLRGKNAGRWS